MRDRRRRRDLMQATSFYCSSSSPVVVPIDPQGRPHLCVFLSLFEDLEKKIRNISLSEVAEGGPFIEGRVLILDQVQCIFRIFWSVGVNCRGIMV